MDKKEAENQVMAFPSIQKLDTKKSRLNLPETLASWMENLQPIAPNNLVAVPAPGIQIASLGGQSITRVFGVTLNGVDYVIVATVAGLMFAVNLFTNQVLTIVGAGAVIAPDVTVYASQRILIADQALGYATWDGRVFVAALGVSPNIEVLTGGSGYTNGAAVTFTGSGGGASAHIVAVGGVVVQIILDSPGNFYSGAVGVVIGGGGSGATASARAWPTIPCTTIAVFGGRVWFGNGRVLQWTGTAGYDDTNPANAAGSLLISDSDLSHQITALRSLNNYLFIFGDSSIKQIGSVSVQSGITFFTILTLTSDVGTTFPLTIASLNRLVLFSSEIGVFAIYGASVEKVSDDLDGIFDAINFGQPICAAVADIRNIRCYLLLLRYNDPLEGPRSIIAVFQEKKWWIANQGANLQAAAAVFSSVTGTAVPYGSSGTDLSPLFRNPNGPVAFKLATALSAHGSIIQAKVAIRAGVLATVDGTATINMEVDAEQQASNYTLNFTAPPIIWVNNQSQAIIWINNLGQVVTWAGTGPSFQYSYVNGYGKMLGLTITGTLANFSMNAAAIEYRPADIWGAAGQ
jgi:hypothetical protein